MELLDSFGRTHRDLRLSVTDRCNFRCMYCMPEAGLKWIPSPDILTIDEIERLVGLLVEDGGITSVRITGGEPTMRREIVDIIKVVAETRCEQSMTTNGSTLAKNAERYRAAGLNRVNISIDSLRPERFAQLRGSPDFDKVRDGIAVACEVGFSPVKLNVVVVRGHNDDEIVDFIEFARTTRCQVRFIEFMPIDAHNYWNRDLVVPSAETIERIGHRFPIVPIATAAQQPSRDYLVDSEVTVGVISSVTEPFCETCDRVRITADGQLRNCLFTNSFTDLRSLMRDGASDSDLMSAITGELTKKAAGGNIGSVHFIKPLRSMSQIGG